MLLINRQERHIPVLDWMRGIAAILVCSSHLRNSMFVDWGEALDHGLINKFLYGITGFGHQSVIVFFVLSGYLVGGSVMAAGKKFHWPVYLITRLSRLWVVLVPCLFITFAADAFTYFYAHDVLSGDYANRWHSAPIAGKYSISWQTLLGNIFFVQTIIVPVYGSNGPLWSLASEFWYYIIFPLLMTAVGAIGGGSRSVKLLSLVLCLIVIYWLPMEIVMGFFVWVMGVGVNYIGCRLRYSAKWNFIFSVASIVFFLAALVFSKWGGVPVSLYPWIDLLLGAAFAIFLLCSLQWRVTANNDSRRMKFSRWISDVSFSLYLSHFPLVIALSAYYFHDASLQPYPAAWIVFFFILAMLLVVARTVWWLFERRTPSVKKILLDRFVSVRPRH